MIFEEVAQRMSDVREPLRLFSEYATDNIERGFNSEVDPAGSRWAPLSPAYAKRKKGPSILTESTDLREGIQTEIVGNTAVIGPDSSILYHAVHQGKTDRNPRLGTIVGHGAFVPARTYIGATEQDAGNFGLLLLAHLRGLTRTS